MKTPLAVLIWTMPDEPEFADALARHHEPYWIVPLRYQALQAARRSVPQERILETSALVPPDVRRTIYDRTIARVNALWERLRMADSEPWLGCIQYYMAIYTLYAADFWNEFLDRLPVEDISHIRHYEPISRTFLSGFTVAEVDMLTACLKARAGAMSPPSWRGHLRTLMGGLCNRLARHLQTPGDRQLPEPASHVICGLQSTDVHSQAHIVNELIAHDPPPFRWMVPAQERHAMMADESDAAAVPREINARKDVYDLDACGFFQDMTWRHPRFEEWSNIHITRRLADALRELLEESRLRCLSLPIAHMISLQNPGLRIRYSAIDRIMRAYNPDSVVVNSTIDQCAYVSGWTRSMKRKLTILPHGVHSVIDFRFHWDAHLVGVIGPFTQERVEEMGLPRQKCSQVGGVHVAVQGQKAARVVSEARAARHDIPRRALFLLGNNFGFSFPDTVDEIQRDLAALVEALSPLGWSVAIRGHPRSHDAAANRRMVTVLQSAGIAIEWSDGHSSLATDLAASGIALTRAWDAAVVTTLYAGIPLVGWLPRPIPGHAESLMKLLPLCFSAASAVSGAVADITREPSRVDVIASRQRAILAAFVTEPFGDPYGRAVNLCRTAFAGNS